MGGKTSIPIVDNHPAKQYLPRRSYTPYPQSKYGPQGTVIMFFKAIPKGYSLPREPEDLFWWVDCKFLPYQDHSLVVSVGAYEARTERTPLVITNNVNGLLYTMTVSPEIREYNVKRQDSVRSESVYGEYLKWNGARICPTSKTEDRSLLRFNEDCDVIKGTRSSSLPCVNPHPGGDYVSYVGQGKIHVLDLETLDSMQKFKESSSCNFRFITIAPNGYYIALLTRNTSKRFQLSILEGRNQFLPTADVTNCNILCPGFYGTRMYTEQVECAFSPDSSLVAVSSSFGMLFVAKRLRLQGHCNIIPGVFKREEVQLANARAFDFDPRYRNKFLTFADRAKTVHICDLNECSASFDISVETDGEIDCLKYGVRGEVLAVATSTAMVNMYSPDTGDLLYALDATNQVPEASMVAGPHGFPRIIRLSFARSGDVMSMTSTDGYVRLWQLQPSLSLRRLARLAVLRYTRRIDIPYLPLPPTVLLELLEWPT